ncbi:MAG: ATP-dependent RecD-like DNA helicase [Clostridia bacterium]|nr:ATP-dependent RecD-like DNA helicase [Clostridia bacterium]
MNNHNQYGGGFDSFVDSLSLKGKAAEETPKSNELKGTVEGILYRNDDNGYIVATVISDEDELVNIVGIMPDVDEGDRITAHGKWENNARYGKQYRVIEYIVEMPTEAADIERYLASGAIKGIRAKTARRIVAEFGEDTVDVIENHPDWLSRIPGISPKRALEISEEFKSKSDMRATVAFFREYFGPATTMKIYSCFGKHSVSIAKDNPYRLCEEVRGIGFDKADAMAQKLGLSSDSSDRIGAGIVYILTFNAAQNGHTCLPREKLVEAAASLLGVDAAAVSSETDKLITKGRLFSETVGEDTYIYESLQYKNERYIAEKLWRLKRSSAPLDFKDIEAFVRKEEVQNRIEYADEQKKAIFNAMTSGVFVLTGGPGTGKTTVVTAIINIYESLGLEVALAAPTGRAAKRMTEATGREAKTVHRLLEVDFGDGDRSSKRDDSAPLVFKRGENNYLDEDAIIIDEASMLDTVLTASLLKAVRPGARIVFIGDADQLPSVGAGNVLCDILDSGVLPSVRLSKIFRQAEESLIVTNAHAINRGEMPRLDVKDRDFFFMPRESDAQIASTVASLCAERLPRAYGDPEGIQVISPTRRGNSGTDKLNSVLQAAINPPARGKKEHKFRDTVFRTGDRVMQVRNNYELEWTRYGKLGMGIFNGDIGKIKDINPVEKYIEIDFDSREVFYEFTDLEDLELAYCVTVHKSQGSEYPTVVLPLGSVPPMLCTRNLLYTAVTRAQKRVIVVGFESTIETMVGGLRSALRYTGLSRRLCEVAFK